MNSIILSSPLLWENIITSPIKTMEKIGTFPISLKCPPVVAGMAVVEDAVAGILEGEAEEAVVSVGGVALPITHITLLVLMRISLPKPKCTPKMNGEISHAINSNKFTGRKSKPGE